MFSDQLLTWASALPAMRQVIVRIPVHATLRSILEETPKAKRRVFVVPKLAAFYTSGKRYLVTDRIQDHFIACGITTQKPGTGQYKDENGKLVKTGKRAVVEVGFHSLRHSFVSICRAANVPLSVVESLVGHSNPAMTRLYTHTSEAAAGAAVALLPDVTASAPAALALPAPATSSVDLAAVRALVAQINQANMVETKARLLELLPSVSQQA